MHICFVVEGYPTKDDPFMTFVRNLIVQVALQGHRCTVIVPQSITKVLLRGTALRPRRWEDPAGGGVTVKVLQPWYFSFSNRAWVLKRTSMTAAARRAFRTLREKPDVLYGHFWHMAAIASRLNGRIPLFAASGECDISATRQFSGRILARMQSELCGSIYVSEKARVASQKEGLQKEKPFIVLPNAVDPSLFYPRDRETSRKILGWPKDAFVVAFVGSFIERKGVARLSRALEEASRSGTVHACFIGSGRQRPDGGNLLFEGTVAHSEVPVYLSASDVFALPTLSEGCSNAIVEAMACGLPVISSDLSFNDEILSAENAIRLDPLDVGEIAKAICRLRDDAGLRQRMGAASLKKAGALDIRARTDAILGFIRKSLEEIPAGNET